MTLLTNGVNGEVFGKAGELPNTLDHIGAAKEQKEDTIVSCNRKPIKRY